MRRPTLATFALVLSTLVATSLAGQSAPRGPSTQEERDKAVALVKVTETEPWSDAARDARAWLQQWLAAVPDITVKQCHSLLGTRDERGGVPADLQLQIALSGAGYLIQHPSAGAGSTETLRAALEGTLHAYQAQRSHGAAEVPRLEQLLKLQRDGQLEFYVRSQARGCT